MSTYVVFFQVLKADLSPLSTLSAQLHVSDDGRVRTLAGRSVAGYIDLDMMVVSRNAVSGIQSNVKALSRDNIRLIDAADYIPFLVGRRAPVTLRSRILREENGAAIVAIIESRNAAIEAKIERIAA